MQNATNSKPNSTSTVLNLLPPNNAKRQPPASIDAELALLGSVLIAPTVLAACALIVDPGDFFLIKHGTIWRTMNDMRMKGEPIDLMTLCEALRHEGVLQSAGGMPYIAGLLNNVPTHTNATFYAELIARAARRRDLLKVSDTMREMAYDESTELNAVLDTIQMDFGNVSAQARRGGVVETSELVEMAIQQIERRMAGDMPLTMTTGLIDLDRKLDGGWWLGKVHYIQGRMHHGKSLVAKNAALNAARAGVPTMIVSTEIPRDDLMHELIAIEAGLKSKDVKTGNLTGAQFGMVLDAATRINRMPLTIISSRTLSAAELQTLVEEYTRTCGVQVVIVDYLQNMFVPAGRMKSKKEEIDYFSRSIVTISQKYNVAMIVTAQVKRDVEYRQDKRPTGSDGDGSSMIEKDADLLIGTYIPYRHDPAAPENGLELIILKNRLTQTYGTVDVLIDSNSEKLHNAARRIVTVNAPHRKDFE